MEIKRNYGIVKKVTAAVVASAMLFGMTVSVPEEKNEVSAAGAVTVDLSKTYQTIVGFGGINHPEWTGSDLSDSQRKTAFGNGDNELGMTVLRVFVNPDKNQWNKAVPTAKYASQNGVTVFASPWEPPSNLAESGGNNGKLHLKKSSYAAYAQHLNDFGSYMKNNGVDLYAISVQNEPDYAKEWTYWSTDETTDFLANYADKITSTKVMSPESFQFSPDGASWIAGGDGGKRYYKKILNNAKAFANCDVFGTHFYGTTRDWMDYPELENCGKQLWMTEVYVPNSDANSNNKWPEAIQVSENIHNGLVVSNLSAYVWWYIRRSYGPMSEDGTISKRGYCMAQYSKYVRPGYKRVDCTEKPANGVSVSAYAGGGDKVVVVAVNNSDSAQTSNVNIKGATIKSVNKIMTTDKANLAKSTVNSNGSAFDAEMPARSVSTFVVTASGSIPESNDPTVNTPPEPEKPNENGWYFQHSFEKDTCDWTARGGTTIESSSKENYTDKGSNSLSVSGRTASWNAAQFTLNPYTFKAGETYSFSAHAKYTTGDDTDNFKFTMQYTGSDGETHYDEIASSAAVKGKWVQLANPEYKIPDGAENMVIYVETTDSTIDFYVDEVIGAVGGTKIAGEGAMEVPDTPVVKPGDIGDLNGDGIINVFDLCLAKRGVKSGFSSAALESAADIDGNGKADSTDIGYIQQYIVRKIDKFPVPDKPIEQPTETQPTETQPQPTETQPAEIHRTISQYTPAVAQSIVENEPESSKQEKGGVNYGTLESKSYYSDFCKREKKYHVLLPAGYSTAKKYPVMYVMHGYWENQDRMIIKGNGTMYTKQIVGNAIAEGEAKEMILVFPYIYSSQSQNDCNAMDDANNIAYDNFDTVLTTELMPLIEKNYSVATGKANTAITGFSMGGRESLNIGMKHPDLFGYVGAICPAPGATGAFKFESEEASPNLIMITAGAKDEVVYTTPNGYHDNFTKNNVPHVWHYVNNGYHGDNSIHAHLYNFVRAAFKA